MLRCINAAGSMSEVVTPASFYWEAILVALGAVPGAWLRLRVVNHFEPVVPHKHWGTFVVNVSAAFFLGLFSGLHALQLKACSGVNGTAPMMLLVGVGSSAVSALFPPLWWSCSTPCRAVNSCSLLA